MMSFMIAYASRSLYVSLGLHHINATVKGIRSHTIALSVEILYAAAHYVGQVNVKSLPQVYDLENHSWMNHSCILLAASCLHC